MDTLIRKMNVTIKKWHWIFRERLSDGQADIAEQLNIIILHLNPRTQETWCYKRKKARCKIQDSICSTPPVAYQQIAYMQENSCNFSKWKCNNKSSHILYINGFVFKWGRYRIPVFNVLSLKPILPLLWKLRTIHHRIQIRFHNMLASFWYHFVL